MKQPGWAASLPSVSSLPGFFGCDLWPKRFSLTVLMVCSYRRCGSAHVRWRRCPDRHGGGVTGSEQRHCTDQGEERQSDREVLAHDDDPSVCGGTIWR